MVWNNYLFNTWFCGLAIWAGLSQLVGSSNLTKLSWLPINLFWIFNEMVGFLRLGIYDGFLWDEWDEWGLSPSGLHLILQQIRPGLSTRLSKGSKDNKKVSSICKCLSVSPCITLADTLLINVNILKNPESRSGEMDSISWEDLEGPNVNMRRQEGKTWC